MAEPEHVTWADAQQVFHVGDACQHAPLPPLDTLVNPPPEPPVALMRDPNLRVNASRPISPPPLDKDGNPREVPPGGLARDPETGALIWPEVEASASEPATKTTTTTRTSSTSTSSTS